MKYLFAILLIFASSYAGALELRTSRDPDLCEPERYVKKVNNNKCPSFFVSHGNQRDGCIVSKTETKRNSERCGSEPGQCICWDNGRGGCSRFALPTGGCLRYSSRGKSCTYPVQYRCYEPCRRPEFGVELYQMCSYYKTPADARLYITNTRKSIRSFKRLLADTKGQLLAETSRQNDLACLIEDYELDPFYSDIINDLEKYFKHSFGMNYDPSLCVRAPKTAISVILKAPSGNTDCDDLSDIELDKLKKPQGVNTTRFDNFLSQCGKKKSYDFIVQWFQDTQWEVDTLIKDLAAKKYQDIEDGLLSLDTELATGVN